MSTPSVAFSVWIWAALDPVLIGVAVWLGWHATQAGKIFIAAIAALGIAILADYVLTRIGIPWVAPLSQDAPMLLPVRAVAGVVWSALAFVMRGIIRPNSGGEPI